MKYLVTETNTRTIEVETDLDHATAIEIAQDYSNQYHWSRAKLVVSVEAIDV